ncbi:hypothetical protein HDU76_000939 [Blyttiomyces sp. JEL0837]|nr:hypothetical protein HDU76_000939 [Blyttiomyces sp. JEL0837]
MTSPTTSTNPSDAGAPPNIILKDPHSKRPTNNNKQEDEEDEYNLRIKRTGCFDQHESMLDCHFRTKDWRQCKDEMKRFRECMKVYEEKKAQRERELGGGM